MILTQLKAYLDQHASVSRKELAKQFHLSEDGVDAMLSVWIRKGRISRLVDTNEKQKVIRVRYTCIDSNAISLTVTM